jgi:hypothetical protein
MLYSPSIISEILTIFSIDNNFSNFLSLITWPAVSLVGFLDA